jgi:hypothetical protein
MSQTLSQMPPSATKGRFVTKTKTNARRRRRRKLRQKLVKHVFKKKVVSCHDRTEIQGTTLSLSTVIIYYRTSYCTLMFNFTQIIGSIVIIRIYIDSFEQILF